MSIKLAESVGRGGRNREPDTRKIQRLLSAIFPGAALVDDGLCGPKTIRRIERFQRRFMADPDGRVDPNGRTLRRMNSAAPALQSDWSGDSSKWSQKKKLSSLNSPMRKKIVRVLDDLTQRGLKPKIYYAWRSVAVQREFFEKGNSKVRFSFHNA